MKRFLLIALMLMLAIPAFASVGVQEDGTSEGTATDLNISTGLNLSNDGSTATLTIDQAGDLTFRTNITAIGRYTGASTAASSSTNLAPASLPYAFLMKSTHGNGSLDETDGGTRLPNGQPGQVLTLMLGAVSTNGSWIITPATTTGFSAITLDAIGDFCTLLYVNDTYGWILIGGLGYGISLENYGAGY